MPLQAEEPWLQLVGPWEIAQYDGPDLDPEDGWQASLDGLDWIPAAVPHETIASERSTMTG